MVILTTKLRKANLLLKRVGLLSPLSFQNHSSLGHCEGSNTFNERSITQFSCIHTQLNLNRRL
jgi:hypothetical protein